MNYKMKKIPIKIVKRRKKSLSIKIKSYEEVEIAIPNNLPYKIGKKFAEDKRDWIYDNWIKLEEYASKTYSEGEEFFYLGKKRKLRFIEGEEKVTERTLYLKKDRVIEWYYDRALEVLGERTKHWSSIIGKYPKKIKVRDLKSAWGICYSTGTITFNVKLITAPMRVIDYLVIHELCHMEHPNHSKEFWNLVGSYIADYKECRNYLKVNRNHLYF